MLKAGLATVYEAKSGAEFAGKEAKYRSAEAWAKLKRKGIWAGSQKNYESPRDYKTRTGAAIVVEEAKSEPPKSTNSSFFSRIFGSGNS
jgi:hypothetical protein